MSTEICGQMPDGSPVRRATIRGGGLTANFLTYRAVLQDLRLDGHPGPLVLGFEAFDDYIAHSRYFSATARRHANLIRDGHLRLDGRTWQLDTNFLGRHLLHGGAAEIGKRVRDLLDLSADGITRGIQLADGEMGSLGNLGIRQTFSLLEPGLLDIRMQAVPDAPTLCNLAHHNYSNLGEGVDIGDHFLEVAADTYLPVDCEMIPLGAPDKVTGTRSDFRTPVAVRPASANGMIDHNYCLSGERTGLRPVAKLSCPSSGGSMQLCTTEPGLQIFNGTKLNVPVPGLDGCRMGPNAGIALEPQVWPDAKHHTDYPQAVLRPGEVYRQTHSTSSRGHTHEQPFFIPDAGQPYRRRVDRCRQRRHYRCDQPGHR